MEIKNEINGGIVVRNKKYSDFATIRRAFKHDQDKITLRELNKIKI